MSFRDVNARRLERQRARAARRRRRRAVGLLAIGGVAAIVAIIATNGAGGSRGRRPLAGRRGAALVRTPPTRRGSTPTPQGTGHPGNATVPILMYHVINPPPAGAPYPGLYVPRPEFAAQMQALKMAGWHAVTMNELRANWTRGVPLGPGKPVVLSFDNGYESQYTNALPILKGLGWSGVENIQLLGLPPAEGGLTDGQVKALLSAGWELDTQGMTHADLITLPGAGLHYEIAHARALLRTRYGVPVNWFCYPSGHYDPSVIAAVRSAGFVGSTTVVPGWASRAEDPYRLPRLEVLGGTSPQGLLAQIAAAQHAAPPPSAYPRG